jgi:hypothetical protein
MKFELLCNEMMLDLFECLSIYDLFHGFYNLNSRFNNLLKNQLKKFHLDLQLLSKTKCINICQNIVPLIIHQIVSLRLSNDENTPYAMKLFFSQNYQLQQLTRLQSISLNRIQLTNVLNQLMIECTYLHHLTYLLIDIDFRGYNQSDADQLYNQIWGVGGCGCGCGCVGVGGCGWVCVGVGVWVCVGVGVGCGVGGCGCEVGGWM